MALSSKQQEYLACCSRRWNLKVGATGSGKSWLDYAVVIPKRLMALRGQGAAVLLGNTQGTLSRNVLDPMRQIWGDTLVGSISSDNTARLFGRRVYILGADNKKHVARIQGMTIEYAYGDEMTTWDQDVFEMLKSRLRCPHSFFDGTANPAHPQHFLKQFIDSGADVFCQTSTIDDNPFLPESFVESLKQEYAGTFYYNRFILGQWVAAEGLVYPMFDPARHVVRALPEGCTDPRKQRAARYFISLDYGTRNPFSAGLWCFFDGTATRIAEYYYDGRKHAAARTDEEHYAALERLAGSRPIERLVIDPSAASMIETIRRHGRFAVRAARNEVLPGIGNVAALLQAGALRIHESCRDCIREFGSYRWDERAGEDRPIKEYDHAMDDTRYFVRTILRREMRDLLNDAED